MIQQPHLGIYPKGIKLLSQRSMCTFMSSAVLPAIVKVQKQLKYLWMVK